MSHFAVANPLLAIAWAEDIQWGLIIGGIAVFVLHKAG